jgi:hypothetical protein
MKVFHANLCIIQLHGGGGGAENLQVWPDMDEVSLKMDEACIKLWT